MGYGMRTVHLASLCIVLVFLAVACSDRAGTPTAAPTEAPSPAPPSPTEAQPGEAPVTPAPPTAEGHRPAPGPRAPRTAPPPAETAPVETDAPPPGQGTPPGGAEAVPDEPGIQPTGGVFAGPVTVTIPSATQGVQFAYTLDGSDPVPGKSPVYAAPLTLPASTLVKVVAFRPSGLASPVRTEDYTVGEVCVNGGPAGQGTRSRPFNTLGQAVAAALSLGIKTIKVGPDPVDESRELTAPLGYSGGWNRGFTAKTGRRSVIQGVAMVGGDKKSATFGWKISGAQASGALLDGFEVRAGQGTYSAALVVDQGAAPRITNCTFVGGPGQYGYGVLVLSRGAPTFEGCTLSGGPAASSFGLAVDDAEAVVQSTRVAAGGGTVTGAGISVTSGRVRVAASVVAGNGANTAYGIALFNSQGTRIEGSTVWGGNGRKASAVFVSEGNPTIVGTTLAAQGTQVSYGINHNYGRSAPSQLRDVVFAGCSTALYHNVNTQTDYTTLGPGGSLTTATGLSFELTTTSGLSRTDIPATGQPWNPGTGVPTPE